MNSPVEKDLRTALHSQAGQRSDDTITGSVVPDVHKRYRRTQATKVGAIGLAAITVVGAGAALLPNVMPDQGANEVILSSAPTSSTSTTSGPENSSAPGTSPATGATTVTPDPQPEPGVSHKSRKDLASYVFFRAPEKEAQVQYAKDLTFADCMRKAGFAIEDPANEPRPADHFDAAFLTGVGPENGNELETALMARRMKPQWQKYYEARNESDQRRWNAAAVGAEEWDTPTGVEGVVPMSAGCRAAAKVAPYGSKAGYKKSQRVKKKLAQRFIAMVTSTVSTPAVKQLNQELEQCYRSKGFTPVEPTFPGLVQAESPQHVGSRSTTDSQDLAALREAVRVELSCQSDTKALDRYYSALLAAEAEAKQSGAFKKDMSEFLRDKKQELERSSRVIRELTGKG